MNSSNSNYVREYNKQTIISNTLYFQTNEISGKLMCMHVDLNSF